MKRLKAPIVSPRQAALLTQPPRVRTNIAATRKSLGPLDKPSPLISKTSFQLKKKKEPLIVLAEKPPPPLPEEEKVEKTKYQIAYERIQNRNICHCEADALLSYALCVGTELLKDDILNPSSKKLGLYKTQFINGDFTPKNAEMIGSSSKTASSLSRNAIKTELKPLHTLNTRHYIPHHSDTMFQDLSKVFGVPLTEKHLVDPNPSLNGLLDRLQVHMAPFLQEFKPYELMTFPFILCISGPPESGKTTVCQFLQKTFDAHIIQCTLIIIEKPKGKQSDSRISQNSNSLSNSKSLNKEEEEQGEDNFPLPNADVVVYSDEKTAVNEIVSIMKGKLDGKGFIIDGFPNNKNQYTLFEKALNANGIHLHDEQSKYLNVPLSARQKASLSPIDGVIITASDPCSGPTAAPRLIDPVTGNIYKQGWHMPGIADMIGIEPSKFEENIQIINSRLIENSKLFTPGDENKSDASSLISTKLSKQLIQFEQSIKKASTTLIIGECNSTDQLMDILDGYIENLFCRTKKALIFRSPFSYLMKPDTLIKPSLSFSAINSWINCLKVFGKTLADQTNIVETLSNKVESLQNTSIERYQLMISRPDERLPIIEKFVQENFDANGSLPGETRTKVLPELFRKIWDLSINSRNEDLEMIDDVIDCSGQIEILLELRKAPKIAFIAFVERLLYVKWFSDKYERIAASSPNELKYEASKFFQDPSRQHDNDIPHFNLILKDPPSYLKSSGSQHKISTNIQINVSTNQENNDTDSNNAGNKIDKSKLPPRSPTNNTQLKKTQNYPNPNTIFSQSRIEDSIYHELSTIMPKGQNIEEMRTLAEIGDLSFLKDNIKKSLEVHPIEDIHFNSTGACTNIGIVNFEPSSPTLFEQNTLKYADEFFSYVAALTDTPLIADEARQCLKLFRLFATNCQKKESKLANTIIDLRNQLAQYAVDKCTREMESFSRKFRYIKAGGIPPKGMKWFEYDTKCVSKRIAHLADMNLDLNHPIIIQSMLDTEDAVKIAKVCAQKGIEFTSVDQLLQYTKEANVFDTNYTNSRTQSPLSQRTKTSKRRIRRKKNIDNNKDTGKSKAPVELYTSENVIGDEKLMKLELCIRISECSECFNIKDFLLSFARTNEDKVKLEEALKKPVWSKPRVDNVLRPLMLHEPPKPIEKKDDSEYEYSYESDEPVCEEEDIRKELSHNSAKQNVFTTLMRS